MKKNEIYTIITTSFKKIEKSFQKIIVDFQTEDIQHFRSEIKKLRAFFRLLHMESNGTPIFKVTRKINIFYGYVGIIRNLQLHLEKVNHYFENFEENIPSPYLIKLEKELDYWKQHTREFIEPQNNFYNDEDEILAALPDKLTKESIKKFIHYTTNELHNLSIAPEGDQLLHHLRKCLEDIIYNWPFVQPYYISVSAHLPDREEVESLIAILGSFTDKCIDIKLIQTYQDDSTKNDELVLQKIIHTWKIQKREIKQIMYDWLDLILSRQNKVKEIMSLHGHD